MEAGIKPVNWHKPLTLNGSPFIFNIPSYDKEFAPVISNIPSNISILHSQKLRQSILESKKQFLNNSLADHKPEDEQMEEKSIPTSHIEQKKHPSKKIGYKIKKQSSIYRRNVSSSRTISANKVAELTKKFNDLVEGKNISEQSLKKIVKRVNSQKNECDSDKLETKSNIKSREVLKVSRKPSLKTKPSLDSQNLVIIKTRPSVNRKVSLRVQNSDKMIVSAKLNYVDKPQTPSIIRPNTLDINPNIPSQIIETSPNGTVKAAIEIFERRSAVTIPIISSPIVQRIPTKPKIADKYVTLKTLAKNSSEATTLEKVQECKCTENAAQETNDKSETTEETTKINSIEFNEKVQIINIPAVLPQRRCDSMYETATLRKPPAAPLKSKSEETIANLDLAFVKPNLIKPNTSFLWRDRSPIPYEPLLVKANEDDVGISYKKTDEKGGNKSAAKQLPPDIPPRPTVSPKSPPTQNILKKKMPLPDEIKTNTNEKAVTGKELNLLKDSGYDEEVGTKRILKDEEGVVEVVETSDKTNFEKYTESVRKECMVINNTQDQTEVSEEYEKNKDYEEISNREDKIYEELVLHRKDDGYEPVGSRNQDQNDGYEYCSSPQTENIYETLPTPPFPPRRQQQEPLPPRPPSSNCASKSDENVSNCYESIYNSETKKCNEYECNYESIYGSQLTDTSSFKDGSLRTNSIYGKQLGDGWDDNSTYKAPSDTSSSDKSDEWVDVTDNEEGDSKIIIIKERHKIKKSGWSQHLRDQWSKTPSQLSTTTGEDSDSDHHYEKLFPTNKEEYLDDDYDSFDSDSDHSFDEINTDDANLNIENNRLPKPPNTQQYGLMKFAGKHMKKLKRNFSIDINKTLSKMTKKMPRTDLFEFAGSATKKDARNPTVSSKLKTQDSPVGKHDNSRSSTDCYVNLDFSKDTSTESHADDAEKTKSLPRKGFLNKFRKSMSLSPEIANELTASLGSNKSKSTFYLTETIDVDVEIEKAEEALPDSDVNRSSLSPVLRHSKSTIIRPQSPPPPAPINQNQALTRVSKNRKSWHLEAGVIRNSEVNTQKRPNTFWYAEIGLYQPQNNAPPSTSSTENSGSTVYSPIQSSDFINHDNNEAYYNMKNECQYGGSINSFSSVENKRDESLTNVQVSDIHERLHDEPLYQFYDAAVLESVCSENTSDSDNYEDIPQKQEIRKLSAVDLAIPKRNSMCLTRTLWCEIPEVIHSSVLSTLSSHQKKLQEAKFEIITSEVSYLNSLNVLINHFINGFKESNVVTLDENEIVFGKIEAVKNSSEKLLQDLEKCWQDNILLDGICEIVQKHAEENFFVYVPYCENQIILDDTLKILKERSGFTEYLKQLEMSVACQSLTLYSFLMLPMQRITRWPLLMDAVLKRLSEQDPEYYACQYSLATLNKIVNQCNEAARLKERETEIRKISDQLEFPKTVPYVYVATPNRWLVRSGSVTQIQARSDDVKLTFGKRFNKVMLHLFLFNDMFFVTKKKSDNIYTVMHYCERSFVELSSSEVLLGLPAKNCHGKNLLFITILENQDKKTVELLISCDTESNKERWVEAFSPPKSENPDEVLYEQWDCPQVTAIHNYTAGQPDELALSRGDVINVHTKMADGWYLGERIRDGQTGWFPANHTKEIANPHVRARNLKQRYRLLAFSENYLKMK